MWQKITSADDLNKYIYISRGAWSSSRGTSGWSMTTWSYSHYLSSSILIKTSFLSLGSLSAAQSLQIGWVSARTSTALPLRLGHFFSVPATQKLDIEGRDPLSLPVAALPYIPTSQQPLASETGSWKGTLISSHWGHRRCGVCGGTSLPRWGIVASTWTVSELDRMAKR